MSVSSPRWNGSCHMTWPPRLPRAPQGSQALHGLGITKHRQCTGMGMGVQEVQVLS